MSRTNFYRKIKSLTGISGKAFINSIRLKRAAYLLKQNKMRVSDVAYAIGHSNPHYFSKWFKAQYGCSPKQFAKENAEVETAVEED